MAFVRAEDNLSELALSPTMQVLGLKLKSSDLAADAFSYWTMDPILLITKNK